MGLFPIGPTLSRPGTASKSTTGNFHFRFASAFAPSLAWCCRACLCGLAKPMGVPLKLRTPCKEPLSRSGKKQLSFSCVGGLAKQIMQDGDLDGNSGAISNKRMLQFLFNLTHRRTYTHSHKHTWTAGLWDDGRAKILLGLPRQAILPRNQARAPPVLPLKNFKFPKS